MEALVDVKQIGIDEESLQITITPKAGTPEEAEKLKKKIREISGIKGPAYVRAVITAYEIEK